jgi:hypothetical protein
MVEVQIGMNVGFEYLGMEKGKGGKEYKNFMVAVEEAEIVGEDVADEGDAPSEPSSNHHSPGRSIRGGPTPDEQDADSRQSRSETSRQRLPLPA